MTPEFKNYLHRCISPIFAMSGLFFFCKALLQKGIRTLFPITRSTNLNNRIKNLRFEMFSSEEPSLNIKEVILDKPFNIKLAIGKMQLKSTADWHRRFNDAEMNVSINRWGWLLTGISGEPLPFNIKEGLLLMRSWASQFINDEELSKDAYSTGERISNGAIFLKLHKADVPPDVINIFKKMAYQVAQNIEYLPSGLTGNHAFNNARALYFAGHVTSSPALTALAIEVACERLSVLVTKDGFMREGSSHYHFLFTRWVLEMIWYARLVNDRDAADFFTPFAEKLVNCCWFFLVQSREDQLWNIPLIGDVSPDCSPGWLMALPWSKLACSFYRPSFLPPSPKVKGWAELFGGLEKNELTQHTPKLEFSSACGWHRVEGFDWTFFTYAPSKKGSVEASHSHLDLCSFALFRNGKPLLVDVGRLDYTNSLVSCYGKSAYSHNTIVLNDLGAAVDVASWMAPSYGRVSTTVKVDKTPESININILHDGFRRIARNSIVHQRKITLSSYSVEIADVIDGKGHYRMKTFFHFAPGITLDKLSSAQWHISPGVMDLFISTESKSFSTFGGIGDNDTGWMFPTYGIKVPIWSLEMEKTIDLPVQVKHKIISNK